MKKQTKFEIFPNSRGLFILCLRKTIFFMCCLYRKIKTYVSYKSKRKKKCFYAIFKIVQIYFKIVC